MKILNFMIFSLILIFSSLDIINAQALKSSSSKKFAVVAKQNSIDFVDLLGDTTFTIDSEGDFKLPIINKTGKFVAYTKDQTLYVASLNQIAAKPIKIDKAENYNWYDETLLIYSTIDGGIKGFDINTHKSRTFLDNDYLYKNIVVDNNKNVYAEKYLYYDQNDIESLGIVHYNLSSGTESLILKSDNNMIPKIAKLTNNSNYIYIYCTYKGESLNTDGVPFGIYNLKTNKLTKLDKLLTFCNKSQLTISPINDSKLILNVGEGRDWNSNKSLVLIDLDNQIFEYILTDNSTKDDTSSEKLATMTPCYSYNAKSLFYAASPEIQSTKSKDTIWFEETHPIYNINLVTKEIKRLTFSDNSFDFSPICISDDNEIIFIRANYLKDKNNYSLFKLKNNQEKLLLDNLKILDFDTFNYLDLFLSE